jgi:hypothetical protein
MFVFICIAIGFVIIVAAAVTVWALGQAPLGSEDETGFHLEPSLKPVDLRAESARAKRVAEPLVASTLKPWPSASSR